MPNVSHRLHSSNSSLKIKNSLKNIISSIKPHPNVTTSSSSPMCCPIWTHHMLIDNRIQHLKPAKSCKNPRTRSTGEPLSLFLLDNRLIFACQIKPEQFLFTNNEFSNPKNPFFTILNTHIHLRTQLHNTLKTPQILNIMFFTPDPKYFRLLVTISNLCSS